jgi:hypothetical protein
VVLAVGIKADVADQHEILVPADIAEGALEYIDRAFTIAAVKLRVGIDDALRRIAWPSRSGSSPA